MMKKIVLVSLVAVLFAMGEGTSFGKDLRQKQYLSRRKWKPGEIIVKFTPKIGGKIDEIIEKKGALKGISLSLDRLFEKHEVKSITKIFKFKGTWKDKIADIRNKFPERTVRVPQNARIPDLSFVYKLEISSKIDIEAAVKEYENNRGVEYAEPNYIYYLTIHEKAPEVVDLNPPYQVGVIPTDTYFREMWSLEKIQAPYAWFLESGKNNIKIGVIDTGIDYNHVDIWDNVWVNPGVIADTTGDGEINLDDCDLNDNRQIEPAEIQDHMFGWDFHNADNDPLDRGGHGTHVSGSIAALTNNNEGIAGISWKSKIIAVKAFSDSGSAAIDILSPAIEYAVDNGADIINMSWGGPGTSDCIGEALDYAHGLGCVLVASAGNDNFDAQYFFPANYENAITVAATDADDKKWLYSNWGTIVDVSAPGKDILSLRANESPFYHYNGDANYTMLSGTSMSCAYVSGVASLILSKNPQWDSQAVAGQIIGTADSINPPMPLGSGRINAYRALKIPLWPRVVVTAHKTDDDNNGESEGNDNGIVEQSETIELTLELKNIGPADATEVTVSLYTTDPQVNLLNNSVSLGEMPAQTGLNSPQPFIFEVLPSKPLFQPIEFNLTIRYNNRFIFRNILNIPVNIKVEAVEVCPFDKTSPDIYEEKIVWQEGDFGNNDILVYDLSLNEGEFITGDSWDQTSPAIYGDKVVWQDNRNGNWDIYMHNLSTGTQTQITSDPADQEAPDIYEDKIIWKDRRNEPSDIYMYDISSGQEIQITDNPTYQSYTTIYGNIIAWSDYRNGNWDIYMHNLSTGVQTQVTNDPANQMLPAIYEDMLLWQDDRNGLLDIYMLNLSTNEETQITTDPEGQALADAYEDIIIWQDYRDGNNDIYMMYDIPRALEKQITFDSADQLSPAIYGNKIVWFDRRNHNADIYMAVFSFPRSKLKYNAKENILKK